MIKITPFQQFNSVPFCGGSAVYSGRTGNAGLTIDDRNRNIEGTSIIRRSVFTMLAIDNDAVFFQAHLLVEAL